jgi:hypothetical protein
MKGAFDNAWHPSILASLLRKHCPPYLTNMVSSFLTNRSAILNVGQAQYQTKTPRGCPQGSLLSPFL